MIDRAFFFRFVFVCNLIISFQPAIASFWQSLNIRLPSREFPYNPIFMDSSSSAFIQTPALYNTRAHEATKNVDRTILVEKLKDSGFLELRPNTPDRVSVLTSNEKGEEEKIHTTTLVKKPVQLPLRHKGARKSLDINLSHVATTPTPSPQERNEILDEFENDEPRTQIQAGEKLAQSVSAPHRASPERPPTYDEDETLRDFYIEWLEYLVDQMKGPSWADTPPDRRNIGFCSDNINLKNRGCALLVPICSNYSAVGNQNAWSCEMAVWKSCACSEEYRSFLRYIMPRPKACYGDVMHTNTLLQLVPNGDYLVDRRSQALIPLGHCALSEFFVVYWVVIGSILIAFASALWPFIRHLIRPKQSVTTLKAASSRVFRSSVRQPSTIATARRLQID